MDNNLRELSNQLLAMPKQMADTQLIILEKSQEAQKIENEISEIETKLKMSIANKLDESGKKVYSNADAREAAFVEACTGEFDLIELKSKLAAIQNQIQLSKIAYERVGNEQKNLRIVLQLFSEAE